MSIYYDIKEFVLKVFISDNPWFSLFGIKNSYFNI